jgi:hypothetical protein
LLVELTEAGDPEGGGRYTLKRWHSEKKSVEAHEGSWRHERVELQSVNPSYGPIVLADGDGARVVAEYVATFLS